MTMAWHQIQLVCKIWDATAPHTLLPLRRTMGGWILWSPPAATSGSSRKGSQQMGWLRKIGALPILSCRGRRGLLATRLTVLKGKWRVLSRKVLGGSERGILWWSMDIGDGLWSQSYNPLSLSLSLEVHFGFVLDCWFFVLEQFPFRVVWIVHCMMILNISVIDGCKLRLLSDLYDFYFLMNNGNHSKCTNKPHSRANASIGKCSKLKHCFQLTTKSRNKFLHICINNMELHQLKEEQKQDLKKRIGMQMSHLQNF